MVAASAILTFQLSVPVLVNRPDNPVLGVRVAEGVRVKALQLDFGGTTDLSDLRAIRVVRLEREAEPNDWTRASAHFGPVRVTGECVSVILDQEAATGPAILWVLLEVSPSADLAHRVRVRLTEAETGEGRVQAAEESSVPFLRLGYRLRHAGDDGSKGYRIPGLVRTNSGTLLACYDIRRASGTQVIMIRRSCRSLGAWRRCFGSMWAIPAKSALSCSSQTRTTRRSGHTSRSRPVSTTE